LVAAEQRLSQLIPLADIIMCTSLEARKGSIRPADERVHLARPHIGQLTTASRLRRIMKDSPILKSHENCEQVQDAYSFRCTPQVHGAVLQRFLQLQETLDVELNSATDNPLVFPDPAKPGPHEVISQGNFHGEILALTADSMSHALFELASISERRIDQILDPARSNLPAFLAQNSGLESGLMIVQYVAGASLAELHGHAMPRSAFSTTTSAGQEDHVSMGATACWNLLMATERLSEVLACELFVACEALEFEEIQPAEHVRSLKQRVRAISPPLSGDRSTSKELKTIASQLWRGGWLARIEAECGRLPR
jgi:histidine ammonia-lyase